MNRKYSFILFNKIEKIILKINNLIILNIKNVKSNFL